jgi:hypothetical protein
MTISKNLSIAYGMIIDSNTQPGLTDADKKEKQNWIKFEENLDFWALTLIQDFQ